MKTINKDTNITIRWKVVHGENKVGEKFESDDNLKVFLVGSHNTYWINPWRQEDSSLQIVINGGTLGAGVYDIKAIWQKNHGRNLLTSVRSDLFAITDDIEEAAPVESEELRIVSYVESYGRDGMSAYETAVMRGLTMNVSEYEWVKTLDDMEKSETSRQAAEANRVIEEAKRESAEKKRQSTFEANESNREITFATEKGERKNSFIAEQQERANAYEMSEGARSSEFKLAEASRQSSYNQSERQRQQEFVEKEAIRNSGEANRQAAFEQGEVARQNAFYSNEATRQKNYADNEAFREAAETKREAAETKREQTFTTNEAQRIATFDANERARQTGEATRQSNETTRQANETTREAAEAKRKSAFEANEAQRKQTFETNEAQREAQEQKRQTAEANREATYKQKVDRDDNAPKLTAGFSNNLVGRGEATDEEISFRPSGGETSIEDGTARIERLKGNTVVWNQLAYFSDNTESFYGVEFSVKNGVVTITGTCSVAYNLVSRKFSVIAGHKYLLLSDGCQMPVSSKNVSHFQLYASDANWHVGIKENDSLNYIIRTAPTSANAAVLRIRVEVGNTYNLTTSPKAYDLTQMFGAGNEPTTIEEFNARKPIGIDEYAYNEGELISTNVDEIKSVGFNAIDSLSPDKAVAIQTGDIYNNLGTFATGYIKVLPNTQYYISQGKGAGLGVWLNSKKEVISGTGAVNDVVLSPSDASYLRMTMASADGCIHLVHTGYRNGEYEPYEEFRRSLPISEIKDSEGNALFPNGLLSAGSVYDEITEKKAIKRIGVVDMGTLSFVKHSEDLGIFKASIKDMSSSTTIRTDGLIAERYTVDSIASIDASFKDKTYKRYSGLIYIRDDSYTNSDTFKSAMSGVMLYYELAKPIEVDLPEPLNLDYEVSDFGTEEVISDAPTTPLKADIIYQFNAVDRIRDNSRHTAEAEQLLARLEARIAILEGKLTSEEQNIV